MPIHPRTHSLHTLTDASLCAGFPARYNDEILKKVYFPIFDTEQKYRNWIKTKAETFGIDAVKINVMFEDLQPFKHPKNYCLQILHEVYGKNHRHLTKTRKQKTHNITYQSNNNSIFIVTNSLTIGDPNDPLFKLDGNEKINRIPKIFDPLIETEENTYIDESEYRITEFLLDLNQVLKSLGSKITRI